MPDQDVPDIRIIQFIIKRQQYTSRISEDRVDSFGIQTLDQCFCTRNGRIGHQSFPPFKEYYLYEGVIKYAVLGAPAQQKHYVI